MEGKIALTLLVLVAGCVLAEPVCPDVSNCTRSTLKDQTTGCKYCPLERYDRCNIKDQHCLTTLECTSDHKCRDLGDKRRVKKCTDEPTSTSCRYRTKDLSSDCYYCPIALGDNCDPDEDHCGEYLHCNAKNVCEVAPNPYCRSKPVVTSCAENLMPLNDCVFCPKSLKYRRCQPRRYYSIYSCAAHLRCREEDLECVCHYETCDHGDFGEYKGCKICKLLKDDACHWSWETGRCDDGLECHGVDLIKNEPGKCRKIRQKRAQ